MATLASTSLALRAALLLAASASVACGGDDDNEPNDGDAGDETDGGLADGGFRADGSTQAGDDDGSTPADDDAGPANDAGCAATNTCPTADPLAPFALDCANLPTDGTCTGGPREVLLVVEDSGYVGMFDPTDGHYLGIFKYPGDSYYEGAGEEYQLATQGPDQCIWTVSEDEDLLIERWGADGTVLDKPLEQHYLPVPEAQDDKVIRSPVSVSFTQDAVYVANTSGNPNSRLVKYSLPTGINQPGEFQSVVLAEADSSFEAALPLGDGSLVISDNDRANVFRLAPDGTRTTVLASGLEFPTDVVYAGNGKVLVVDEQGGVPAYRVDLATGVADTISPFEMSQSNYQGLYPLKNGNWLISGGSYGVSVLEPDSSNPRGQNHSVWDDDAKTDSIDFNRIGRACLSETFVASRAPTTPPAPPGPGEACSPVVPDGAALFQEDFEGGQFVNGAYKNFRDRETVQVAVSITSDASIAGNHALQIQGTELGTRNNGASVDIAGLKPKYIAYDVRVSAALPFGMGGVSFEKGAVVDQVAYESLLGTSVYNLYVGADNANAASDLLTTTWIRVEMRNIDWNARTYDLYANCKRIGEGVYIPPPYGDEIDRIHMWNARGDTAPTPTAISWFDNILVK